jgi:hypothetical protein
MEHQPKLGTCDQWQMAWKVKTAKLEAHKLKVREKRLVAKTKKENDKEFTQGQVV